LADGEVLLTELTKRQKGILKDLELCA